MHHSRKIILRFLLLLTLAAAGFYFKDNLLGVYKNAQKNLQNFQKSDLGTLITEVSKEILTPPPLNIGGSSNSAVLTKESVILQTNIQRKSNGNFPALKENTMLDAAAKAKAEDMFKNQYFEHISPSGVGPGELVKKYGYDYIVTGENLILGNFKDEQEVVQLWMDSPGHRANILNNRFTEIGVAMVKGTYKGQTVWIGVQEFGLPLAACSQPPGSLKNQIENNKLILDNLAAQIDAKRAKIKATNQRSEKYNQLVDEYNALVEKYNPLNEETKNLVTEYNNKINAFNACVAGR